MIGVPPPKRGGRPADVAAHASHVAQEWEDVVETNVRKRMRELGIPEHQIGQPDYGGDGRWRAFDPYEREGGSNTTGVVDAGALNPDLFKNEQLATSPFRSPSPVSESLPVPRQMRSRSQATTRAKDGSAELLRMKGM
jgi:hypothetical protein